VDLTKTQADQARQLAKGHFWLQRELKKDTYVVRA
jgi:hypothetical protein